MVMMLVVATAETMCPSRCRMSNHFSRYCVALRVRNISRAPIQSICCTYSSLLDKDIEDRGTLYEGLGSDVHRPKSALVGSSPVVVVAAL